jgi:membrane-associated phospholipid phosphatase
MPSGHTRCTRGRLMTLAARIGMQDAALRSADAVLHGGEAIPAEAPLEKRPVRGARPDLSVYRVHAVVDGVLIAATGLFSALGLSFARALIRPPWSGGLKVIKWGRVNRLDRFAVGLNSDALDVASYALTVVAIGGPLLAETIALGRRKQLLEELVVYAEAIAFTTAIDTVTKYIVQRPLPRVRALQSVELAWKPGGYRSFQSGHVSMAVGCLTVASVTARRRYGSVRLPWAVTAAAALAISAARIGAGRHYITDALAGALTGLVVGALVSWTHLDEDAPRGIDRRLATKMPVRLAREWLSSR